MPAAPSSPAKKSQRETTLPADGPCRLGAERGRRRRPARADAERDHAGLEVPVVRDDRPASRVVAVGAGPASAG